VKEGKSIGKFKNGVDGRGMALLRLDRYGHFCASPCRRTDRALRMVPHEHPMCKPLCTALLCLSVTKGRGETLALEGKNGEPLLVRTFVPDWWPEETGHR
jgi:hypothetical protein